MTILDYRKAIDKLDAQIIRLLNERTRLVAVTAISNVLGTINPLEEIIRRSSLSALPDEKPSRAENAIQKA